MRSAVIRIARLDSEISIEVQDEGKGISKSKRAELAKDDGFQIPRQTTDVFGDFNIDFDLAPFCEAFYIPAHRLCACLWMFVRHS